LHFRVGEGGEEGFEGADLVGESELAFGVGGEAEEVRGEEVQGV